MSGPTKQHFKDECRRYNKGLTSVITKVLAAGLKYLESKQNVMHMVDTTENWRDNPDKNFDVLIRAADESHMLRVADKACVNLKTRPTAIVNGMLVSGGGEPGRGRNTHYG